MSKEQTQHVNTIDGRKASLEARRRWIAERRDAGAPVVFVVRLAGSMPFGWEIRKFGAIVLRRSETGFKTQLMARSAGEKAMTEVQS